jgi:tRNA/tmRNA/rRNA uracil-C5-methylase (TrmA/RlmC/RlmD family)
MMYRSEISRRGDGVAQIEGFVIFVKDGKVHQNAHIRIIHVRNRYANAEIIDVISVTPNTTGSRTNTTSSVSNRTSTIEDDSSEKPFFGTFKLWLVLLLVSIYAA